MSEVNFCGEYFWNNFFADCEKNYKKIGKSRTCRNLVPHGTYSMAVAWTAIFIIDNTSPNIHTNTCMITCLVFLN